MINSLMIIKRCFSLMLLFVFSVHASQVPTSKATFPAAWNSMLSETMNGFHKTVTEKHSSLRRLQGDEDVELDGVCQELLSSFGIGCECIGLSNSDVSMTCTDSTCLWCDEDLERCGIRSSSLEFGPSETPPGYIVGQTVSFEYTTGETVSVAQSSCDVFNGFPITCTECVAYVNDEECTSCAMCEDGFSFSVDCENLATNSSFNDCLAGGPEYGVFQGLNLYTCKYVEPTNDACSDAALLQIGVAMIGRTNGATEESIKSSCNLDKGKDVWYSVEGTGDNIVATTCSYDTYVGTIIDVFSSQDSCEDLECIAATNFSCAAGLPGSIVSWSSEAGVTYHLRVVTVDYEDQFEIVVWEVQPSENTACTTSVVSNSIDTLGSTLDLSDQLETDTCGEIGTPGLWYQVTATEDGVVRASTCSNKTSINTAITVMTGDCDTYTCVKSANANQGTAACSETGIVVDWNVTSGQTYFVYIRGLDSNGIFGVSIEPIQVPVNDGCAAAAVISETEIIQGNTKNATEDFIVGIPCTSESYITPRGVWYKIAGNNKFLRATACPGSSFFSENAISVYMGDCSDLVCAAESSYTNCETSGGQTVSWEALEEVQYYLFVHAPYAAGSFELLIEEFEPSPNIQCRNAEGPLTPANQTIVGSTRNSISEGISDCVSGLNNSVGLWYSVVGKEGMTYRVDTCSEETNFDTVITIYRGSCDDELECVGGNDESCGGSTSSVHWKTEEGVAYYIKIHGFYGAVGDFGMSLSSTATPENDACLNGIVLSSSNEETVVVSLAGSTPDVIPGCSYALFDAPGTWYQLDGQGKAISVSSCSKSTNVASAISVFSGSCEDLLCVSEGIPDYTCLDAVASKAIFLAEEGTTYFILLQSPESFGGDVGLTITEVEGPENDFCQRASNVVIDGGEISGMIVGASGGTTNNGCYFDPSTPDVWYFVDGTGDVLQATACSSEVSFFYMTVLQGTCIESQCIATAYSDTETCATVLFQSDAGETYHILFQAFSESDAGVFSLSVNTSSVKGPENDLCSSAEPIDLSLNTTIFGSTTDAIQDVYEDACSWQSTSRDLWYQVVGNGVGMLASLCSPETDFDTQLSIYSSINDDGSCSALECVATNDEACGGSASQLWWPTVQDKVYFIRVHGFADSVGNFALTVREQSEELIGGGRY
jgi:hypothetical protein